MLLDTVDDEFKVVVLIHETSLWALNQKARRDNPKS